MLKTIYQLFFLCFWISAGLCQVTYRDSLIKAAQADAKTFKLDKATWEKYQRMLLPASDDSSLL